VTARIRPIWITSSRRSRSPPTAMTTYSSGYISRISSQVMFETITCVRHDNGIEGNTRLVQVRKDKLGLLAGVSRRNGRPFDQPTETGISIVASTGTSTLGLMAA